MIKNNIIYKNVILFWAILLFSFLAVQLAHAQFYGDYDAGFGSAGYDYGYGSYESGYEPAASSIYYDSAPVTFVPAYGGYYPFDYGFVGFSRSFSGHFSVPAVSFTPGSSNFSIPAVSFTPGSSNFSVPAVGFTPGSSNFSVPTVSFTPGSSNVSVPSVGFSAGASSFLLPAVSFSPGASYLYAAAPVTEAAAPAPQRAYAATKPSGPAVAFAQIPKTGIADDPRIVFFLTTILAMGAILAYLFMRMFIMPRDARGIFFRRKFLSRDIPDLFESIRITSYNLLSQIPTDEEIKLQLIREMASLKSLVFQPNPDCGSISQKIVLLTELWSNQRILKFVNENEVKVLKSHLSEFKLTIEGIEEELASVKNTFGIAAA